MAKKKALDLPTKVVELGSGREVMIKKLAWGEYRKAVAGSDSPDIALVCAACTEPVFSCVDVGEEIPEGTMDLDEWVGENISDAATLVAEVFAWTEVQKLAKALAPLSEMGSD